MASGKRRNLVSSTKTARCSSGTPIHFETGRPSYARPSFLKLVTCTETIASHGVVLEQYRAALSLSTSIRPQGPCCAFISCTGRIGNGKNS